MLSFIPGLWRLWVRIRNRAFSTAVAPSFRDFGRRSVIQLPVSLWGEDRISIGDGVHIGAGAWLIVLGGERGAEGPVRIRIGHGCRLSGETTITAVRSVVLGDRVLIGRGVHISDHSHRFGARNEAVMDQGVTEAAEVLIGDGSWIGQGVVICPGVRIGRNCVVGANSVVKSDLPDHSVAVGAPARVVRHMN
jgi:acetyltransferase-like isoleucine patch superfamily enzyme